MFRKQKFFKRKIPIYGTFQIHSYSLPGNEYFGQAVRGLPGQRRTKVAGLPQCSSYQQVITLTKLRISILHPSPSTIQYYSAKLTLE